MQVMTAPPRSPAASSRVKTPNMNSKRQHYNPKLNLTLDEVDCRINTDPALSRNDNLNLMKSFQLDTPTSIFKSNMQQRQVSVRASKNQMIKSLVMQNLAQNRLEIRQKPKNISIAKTYFRDKFGNVVSPNQARFDGKIG